MAQTMHLFRSPAFQAVPATPSFCGVGTFASPVPSISEIPSQLQQDTPRTDVPVPSARTPQCSRRDQMTRNGNFQSRDSRRVSKRKRRPLLYLKADQVVPENPNVEETVSVSQGAEWKILTEINLDAADLAKPLDEFLGQDDIFYQLLNTKEE